MVQFVVELYMSQVAFPVNDEVVIRFNVTSVATSEPVRDARFNINLACITMASFGTVVVSASNRRIERRSLPDTFDTANVVAPQ